MVRTVQCYTVQISKQTYNVEIQLPNMNLLTLSLCKGITITFIPTVVAEGLHVKNYMIYKCGHKKIIWIFTLKQEVSLRYTVLHIQTQSDQQLQQE